MKAKTFVMASALFSLAASLIAQVSIPCCIPVDSFPPPTGGQPCAGDETVQCEEAPAFSESGNEIGSLRYARCYTWTAGLGSFVQDDCLFEPDPSWTYVGNMGNGICCYIDTGLVVPPSYTYRDFKIRSCDTKCGGGEH